MKREPGRVLVFILVFCLVLSGLPALGAAGLPSNGSPVVSPKALCASVAQLMDAIGRGALVNGVKGNAAKAAAKPISLAPMPGALGLTYQEGVTNPLSVIHPVMIATSAGTHIVMTQDNMAVTSSNPAVAMVTTGVLASPEGQAVCLKALSKGVTTLQVVTQGKRMTKVITVQDTVPISSISIQTKDDLGNYSGAITSKLFALGEGSVSLYLTASPSTATYGCVSMNGMLQAAAYSSTNEAVALVSGSALPDKLARLIPVGEGKAILNIRATDGGGAKAALKVTVKKMPVKAIKLDAWSGKMFIGDAKTLGVASILPANATNKAVLWSSSNSKVATVDGSGNIAAVKAGTATITAKAADGGKAKAAQKVTVRPILVTSIAFDAWAGALGIGVNKLLGYAVLPANATNNSVVWSSSNRKAATVDSQGNILGIAAGITVITCKAADGSGVKATKVVTVSPVLATSIALAGVGKVGPKCVVGSRVKLMATFTPANATNQSLTWASGNEAVATVDAAGLVTCVGTGKATITCANAASGVSGTYALTVWTRAGAAADDGVWYHFFGIANSVYPDGSVPANENDLSMIRDTYYTNVVDEQRAFKYVNQSRAGILSVLQRMASDTGIISSDVIVFYYAGRVKMSDLKSERGALVGTDGNLVTVDEVQSCLDQVKGTVVVILDCDMAGQYIVSKSASPAIQASLAKSVGRAWSSKLAGSKAKNFTGKALTDSAASNKYKILASCAPMAANLAMKNFSMFGYWLGKGLKMLPNDAATASPYYAAGGTLEADANSNGEVTLDEAYDYVSGKMALNADPYRVPTVSVWPENDQLAIYCPRP